MYQVTVNGVTLGCEIEEHPQVCTECGQTKPDDFEVVITIPFGIRPDYFLEKLYG